MARTYRKHAPLAQVTTRRQREDTLKREGLKTHKQRRANERVRIRKETP